MIHVKKEYNDEKIVDELVLKEIIERKNRKTIGLCVGGFDLLHPGHMTHLRSAKKLCDVLVVGVTADEFVAKRKENPPIYPDFLRAFTVSQLKCVDYVIISQHPTAIFLIELIKPDYYIKGPDYVNKLSVGIKKERETIKHVGGKMLYTNDEKLSTTSIIRYIKEQ